MLRRLALMLVAVTLVLAAWPAGAVGAAKTYAAERYDVAIVMRPGGTLEVTETVVFRFMGGPFTYVWREIPEGKTDGIEFVSASMDGVVFPLGEAPGQIEVRDRGGEVRATWHFAGTSDAAHTFVLTYRALGVVFQSPTADVLEWDALPDDRDYAIGSSTVTLAYPGATAPLAAPQVLAGQAQVETGDGRAIYTARDLNKRATLTIGAQFPRGSVVQAQPQWYQLQAYRSEGLRRAAPVGLVAGLTVLVAGLAGLALYSSGQRRPDTALWAGRPPSTGVPPSDLPPALGTALANSGARASILQAVAALFDLGRQGVLRIVELDEKKWWGGRQYAIELLDRPSRLEPQERGLLDILFSTKSGTRQRVKLDEFARQYMRRSKEFTEPLDREMERRGLLDPARKQARTRMSVAWFAALILSVVLAPFGIFLAAVSGTPGTFTSFYVGGILMGAAAALLLVGIGALIVGATLSPLTERGDAQAASWRAFRDYLKDVTRGRQTAPRLDAFEAYMSFAAGFGLLQQWGKVYGRQANAKPPAWFRAAAGALQDPGGSFAAFAGMTAAVHSSTTSAGGAAGGGAAGGGGSGAG